MAEPKDPKEKEAKKVDIYVVKHGNLCIAAGDRRRRGMEVRDDEFKSAAQRDQLIDMGVIEKKA